MKPTKIKISFAIMATCLSTFALAYSNDAGFQEVEEAKNQKWEYKIIHRLGNSKQTPEGNLNELGRNGWELVLIKQTTEEHLPTYIFKRPVNKSQPDVGANQKLAPLEQKKAFEVSITKEELHAHGNLISSKELEKKLLELPDDTKILIRAEPAVAHKELLSVMDLCAKAGLKDVAIATTKAEIE
ncbi:biopolymer transporter ExbD [Coraliomargarita algicola]|uniref:Biopolymer transporter ExbD n=1 Tax=Coraliomargarita algicola TaxID=3092156 RepID=A0ABZ0RMQ6_9BACT|nr:biopolymer transporter ExbD [Coraliomargarita sp. J2-16]WPJ96050.1 biopolymer transporter ExbD [Coraliomargarita sp. J2-16]